MNIFNPDLFQISLRTNKQKTRITLNILDLRQLPKTEVEVEETATYGITPMYYSDDECMVSAVYLAQIVRETLEHKYPYYSYDCHVYTSYTILPCPEAQAYHRQHGIHVHSATLPKSWHRYHDEEFCDLYRCADGAVITLMRDLQHQTYNPDGCAYGYHVPDCLRPDYTRVAAAQDDTIDTVWQRLRQLSNAESVEGMRMLNGMVGMSACKTYIHQLIMDTQLRRMRSLMGLRPEREHPMHFVFTGNPGTGKTTVAKALGKALHSAGIISRGDVVYRDRSTLVGAHVGDSESMVKQLFEHDATGNVVVIDEAYALTADTWKGDFGHRVVDSLLTYTADPEADYVVVLCGYKEEMEQMLASNPGLRSRFSLRFDFQDFSHTELMEITRRCLAEMDYHFTPEAETEYAALVEKVLDHHHPHFGNARWVQSAIHQHILVAHHRRVTERLTRGVVQLTRELFSAIEASDIRQVADSLLRMGTHSSHSTAPQRRIGFAA